MAGSVNKVILVGNLGRDPETRFTKSGTAVANFTMATTERRKGTDGNWSDETTWHRIVVWDRLAELCQQYLSKGRQVYVEGRIQTRKYTDRDGNERQSTEVVAREVVFLSGRDGVGRGGPPRSGRPEDDSAPSSSRDGGDIPYSPEDDDIPF
jgi:single-strand DNA-binding protein